MKVETEILIDIMLDELTSEQYISLQTLYGYFKTHPLIRQSINKYTLNEVSEIIYTVYFKLKNYNDNKIYHLLSERVFYTIVVFESIWSSKDPCAQCDMNGLVDCDWCNGSGEIEDDNSEENETCDNCWGRGQVDCDWCDGSGNIKDTDEIAYSFHLQSDIQSKTIIKNMENSDILTSDFDEQVSDSPYQFTITSGDAMLINENDYDYNDDYENRTLFYQVIDPNRNVTINLQQTL
jgi:hypothetical protein